MSPEPGYVQRGWLIRYRGKGACFRLTFTKETFFRVWQVVTDGLFRLVRIIGGSQSERVKRDHAELGKMLLALPIETSRV